MRRRLATLVAGCMFALALGSAPVMAAGTPLTHMSAPATALGSICGYAFVSGSIIDTFRTADVVVDPATGEPYIPAAHVTLRAVFAERDGSLYRVVGGEVYSDLTGHLTTALVFVGNGGGIADSIHIVFRSYPSGDIHVYHDLGSCSFA